MRKPLIAGNWKMFKTREEAQHFSSELVPLVTGLSDTEVLICPPYLYIHQLVEAFEGTPIQIGAQNVFWQDQGAFTGEVGPAMLESVGATYAIVGHSERRQYFSETDEIVNKKIQAVLSSSLHPIVCVGETLDEREQGKTSTVIQNQVMQGLSQINEKQAQALVIAYEPVWAIGTGKTATPQIAQEIHAHIREILSRLFGKTVANTIRVLYGGSVNPDTIDALMAMQDIDGALVGGASLDVASFARILGCKG
ncbi:MAG: triose-phosphate isomerase [Desulfomonilia bacterium]|nr:triose-phosphate isomerase [Desulfomonilia bacterium]